MSSAKLYYVRPFPELLSCFFSLIESEISEQASRQVASEEQKKLFVNMPGAVIYVIITWAEAKILKIKIAKCVGALKMKTCVESLQKRTNFQYTEFSSIIGLVLTDRRNILDTRRKSAGGKSFSR